MNQQVKSRTTSNSSTVVAGLNKTTNQRLYSSDQSNCGQQKNQKFIYLLCIIIAIILITSFSNFLVRGENLRVFLIPHSHIDQGWLRTVREYQSETFSILDSVIGQLLEKSHARYVWGDVLYFKEWFEQQPAPRQQQVKKLIKTNRFEFVGGGWIQTDEACASYTSIINSMTVGHEYLLRRFGVRPRVAWQIDPFGHDGKIPQIFSQMGFDALVINRVHFSIKSVMKDEKALEFIWNISSNNTIFTEVLHTHYSSPRNFDFEKPGVEFINDQNVERKAHEFIEDMRKRADAYRTPYILVPMGDDFKFRDAGAQFSNMDRIIEFLDKHDLGVRVQYATTTEYFNELFKNYGSKTKFPVVKQDFVPYADYPDSYWTGYFTSLPNLKKSARTAESILTSTEMLYALARVKMTHQNTMFNWVDTFNTIQRSRQTVGLVQHHDAITGTCRRHVYNDYMSQLASVIQDMKSLHKSLTQHVLEIDKASVLSDSLDVTNDDQHSIIIYNSLSHKISQVVTVNTKCSLVNIMDSAKKNVEYQVIPNVGREKSEIPLPFSIQFVASVDGLAFNSYSFKCEEHSEGDLLDTNVLYVKQMSKHYEQFNSKIQVREISSAKEILLENTHYALTIDKGTGYVKTVTSKKDGKIHETNSQFMEYKTQNSGSYLFRPNEDGPSPLGSQNLEYVYISRGPVVDKAVINTDRVVMTVTLPHELHDENLEEYIDYRIEVNPLTENSETVIRFGVATKDPSAGSMIVYDGFNFVKRTIHAAAPKPGKFYPSTNGALLKFPDSQISVLTDHAMATTANGRELEFLVHRRLMKDDFRGMSEANNDQSSLKFRLAISYLARTTNEDFVKLHQKSLLVNRQPQSYAVAAKVIGQFNIFNKKFPSTGQIISLQARGISSDEVAIRLQNLHPSKPLTIDFTTLFSEGIEVSDLRERSLNLIYEVSEEKRKLRFKKDTVMRFDFTKEVKLKGEGGQNTDQEGVFLSDEAIAEMEKEKNAAGRKLLAISGISAYTITLPPTSIKSYFAAMTFSGKGFVPISKKDSDEDTNNKEINDLGLEDEETVEEIKEDEIRTADEDEEKKIKIIDEEKKIPEKTEFVEPKKETITRPPREKIPFWVFVILAFLIAICGFCCLSLTLMVRRRSGKKERPSVLPMFHADNTGIKTK